MSHHFFEGRAVDVSTGKTFVLKYYRILCGFITVMSSYVFTAKLNLIADTFTLACKFRLSRINRNQIRKILKSYFLKKSVDFFETAEYNVKKGI